MSKFLIGADPEFFLFDTDTKRFISAHGLVPGTKEKPHKLKDGAVQLDGTAVEFNINPAATAFEFSYNISSVLKEIRSMIPTRYEFRFQPSVFFDKDYFDKEVPESSKELGCSPDFNYNYGMLPQTPNIDGVPEKYKYMRTGAGHIHVGWTENAEVMSQSHFWDCRSVVFNMSQIISKFVPYWDTDTERTKLYGNGIVFRPKPYGVEWRTLSNAWLAKPVIWPWLFEVTQDIILSLMENRPADRTAHKLVDLRYQINSPLYKWNTNYDAKLTGAETFKDFLNKSAKIMTDAKYSPFPLEALNG